MEHKGATTGIAYFVTHMCVEVICFYILCAYTSPTIAFMAAYAYDFFAFVPQGLFGWFRDKKKWNFDIAIPGMILMILAAAMYLVSAPAFAVIIILATGNALIHVEGAELTLRSAEGKMAPAAIFVAGGSFGVVTGQLLGKYGIPAAILIPFFAVMLVTILMGRRVGKKLDWDGVRGFAYAARRYSPETVVLLATIVVICRSYMGYGIPTGWKKTDFQTVLLFLFMGTGKAMGGVLIDRIGIFKTAMISTLGALPFLLFGDQIMILSLVGVFFFSMTMAVTLALIVSCCGKYPGVAFGFTTVGLFLGTAVTFIYQVKSFYVNCGIVVVMTLVSAALLSLICRRKDGRYDAAERLGIEGGELI